MNWEQADALMAVLGYETHSIARKQVGGPIERKQYKKDVVDTVRIEVEVIANDTCENCWMARMFYYGLKYFMRIDSQEFRFSRAENVEAWDKLETAMVQFALACNEANVSIQ